MRYLVRLGAAAMLGAGLLLPAWQANANTVQPRAKYNFVNKRPIIHNGFLGRGLLGLQRSTRKAVRKPRAGRVAVRASRRAGYNACRNAARKFGVPISTALAVCRVESGFRCSAVGGAGELGLLQIKLATARGLGYRGSRRELLNCSTGAYWGMKHLALAIKRGGVWKHNAGLGAKRPNRMARKYARLVAAARRFYR